MSDVGMSDERFRELHSWVMDDECVPVVDELVVEVRRLRELTGRYDHKFQSLEDTTVTQFQRIVELGTLESAVRKVLGPALSTDMGTTGLIHILIREVSELSDNEDRLSQKTAEQRRLISELEKEIHDLKEMLKDRESDLKFEYDGRLAEEREIELLKEVIELQRENKRSK